MEQLFFSFFCSPSCRVQKITRPKNARKREREERRGKKNAFTIVSHIGKNRDSYAVANLNVWSLSKHTFLSIHKYIMIIFIITILFLQIIFSTTHNLSNIRFSPLLSAQCKARCLYEYRHHHRSLPTTFIDEKTKRTLVRSRAVAFFLMFNWA